jgi:hypothetical protein
MGVLHAIRTGRSVSEAIASYLQGNDGGLADFARAERSEVDRCSSRILYCWNLSRFSKAFLPPLMPGMTTSVSRLPNRP